MRLTPHQADTLRRVAEAGERGLNLRGLGGPAGELERSFLIEIVERGSRRFNTHHKIGFLTRHGRAWLAEDAKRAEAEAQAEAMGPVQGSLFGDKEDA